MTHFVMSRGSWRWIFHFLLRLASISLWILPIRYGYCSGRCRCHALRG